MNAVAGWSGVLLDVCNGYEDADRGCHYHVAPGRFPYVIGGSRGTPKSSNDRGIRRFGIGAIEDNAEGESRMEAVPADASLGMLLDCHLEFENGRRPRR